MLPQFRMIFDGEVKAARDAVAAHFPVVGFACPHRHTFMGQVGQLEHPGLGSGYRLLGLDIQFLDVVGKRTQFGNQGVGIVSGAFGPGHFRGSRVPSAPEFFHFREQGAAARVQRRKFLHIHVGAAGGKRPGYAPRIFLQDFEVNHDAWLS